MTIVFDADEAVAEGADEDFAAGASGIVRHAAAGEDVVERFPACLWHGLLIEEAGGDAAGDVGGKIFGECVHVALPVSAWWADYPETIASGSSRLPRMRRALHQCDPKHPAFAFFWSSNNVQK